MHRSRLSRAFATVGGGLVLVVGGALVWAAARRANERDALLQPSFGGQPGDPWLVIGGFLALVGIALVVVGVVRLSSRGDGGTG